MSSVSTHHDKQILSTLISNQLSLASLLQVLSDLYKDVSSQPSHAFKLTCSIISNIINHPNEDKFKTLPAHNAKLEQHIFSNQNAMRILNHVGFQHRDTDNSLQLVRWMDELFRTYNYCRMMLDDWPMPMIMERAIPAHNPHRWFQHLRACERNNDTDAGRDARRTILAQTMHACLNGFYFDQLSAQFYMLPKNQLNYSITASVQYDGTEDILKARRRAHNTSLHVWNGDCIEVAMHLRETMPSEKVAVLNMANAIRPGGSYREGSAAQEENLCRRSNLFQCLDDVECPDLVTVKYPLAEFGGIFSPKVIFFRSSESTGYRFLPKPVDIHVLTVAAYRRPKLVQGEGSLKFLEKGFAEGTKQKIRTLLGMAQAHGITIPVLSALGCGSFGNPAHHVAQLFKECLEEFSGCFSSVHFAIFDDANAQRSNGDEGNVQPFERVLGVQQTEVTFDYNLMLCEKIIDIGHRRGEQ